MRSSPRRGSPTRSQRRRPFADTAIGRALIGLLRCVPGRDGPARGEAGDLLAWLRAPGLLERPELADRLEARARRTGANERRAGAGAVGGAQLAARHDRSAARGRSAAAALIERATRELEWLFARPRRRGASVLESDRARRGARARGGAARARRAARARAPRPRSSRPPTRASSRRCSRAWSCSSGERPAPDAVAVLDPLALRATAGARAVRVRAAGRRVPGARALRSRCWPRRSAGVSRRRRASRAAASTRSMRSRRSAICSMRRSSRPEELLVLSWHAADDDGEPLARLAVRGRRLRPVRREPAASAGPAGRWAPRAGRGSPSASARRQRGGARDSAAAASRAAREPSAARRRRRGHVWSASSLELWISCPVRWFVERVLRAEDLDPQPEPFARGGLAHAALKDTLEGLRLQDGLGAADPGHARARARAAGRARSRRTSPASRCRWRPSAAPGCAAACTRIWSATWSTRPAPRPIRRRRWRCARAEALEPSHLELGFGFAEEADDGLPAFDLGGGVMLRGRIDRVDVGGSGEAVVYDYKGASAPRGGEVDRRGEPAGRAVHARGRGPARACGRSAASTSR